MRAPEVQGIDLFKIAGRSISGWIPSLKTGTVVRQPFCSQLEAIGGPLLALGLVSLVGVRTAILLSGIPGVLAALAILYAIRHLPRVTSRERTQLKITVRPLLRGQLGQVLLGVSLFEASNVAATLLILRATHTM